MKKGKLFLREPLGNELITPANNNATGDIECRQRLGGLLKHYYRKAA
jgi:hypothetical protein